MPTQVNKSPVAQKKKCLLLSHEKKTHNVAKMKLCGFCLPSSSEGRGVNKNLLKHL